MTREKLFVELNDIFREVFDDELIEVCDSTSADDIEGWDSLEKINLIVLIEKKFGIKFNMKETNMIKNVGDMADIILNKL